MPILPDSPRTTSHSLRTRRRLRPDGYVDIYQPGHPLARRDGYVFEHRLAAYEAGLLTDLRDQVHHRNRDRSDNRVVNLEVLTLVEHRQRHDEEDGLIRNQYGVWARRPPQPPRPGDRLCAYCDTGIVLATKRIDTIYCSPRCRVAACKMRKRLTAQRSAA